MPPTEKIDIQAATLEGILPAIREQYGYSAALWCAFYLSLIHISEPTRH